MSKFLGPIHFWLYKKIKFQNMLTKEIIKEFNIKEICDYIELEDKPLEEIIDSDNIHGWLQEKVNIVENNYALVVGKILAENNQNLNKIGKIAFNFGKNNSIQEKEQKGIFLEINNLLLDGMPCEKVIEVTEETENYIIFKRNLCVHEKFWHEYIDVYYEIRNELIKGLIENTGYKFTEIEKNVYKLSL